MRVDILTLFPEMFGPFLESGVLGKAVASGRVQVALHDLREYGEGSYRKVDDAPYGGGAGMVLLPGPLFEALDAIQARQQPVGKVMLMSPQGRTLDDETCRRLATMPRLILVCGRYEGVDERFIEARVDEEISIGDYVLSGGELAAMVVVESVARMIPGVLGHPASAENDSFHDDLLEHPQYTRPESYAGMKVPEVLRSGNHREIARWRKERALENTRRKRPDLLEEGERQAESGSPAESA